jgi:hypothetical protein
MGAGYTFKMIRARALFGKRRSRLKFETIARESAAVIAVTIAGAIAAMTPLILKGRARAAFFKAVRKTWNVGPSACTSCKADFDPLEFSLDHASPSDDSNNPATFAVLCRNCQSHKKTWIGDDLISTG